MIGPMMEFTLEQLKMWHEKIEAVVKEKGLDYYPQEYEICTYEDMLGYESYVGMPSHYPHWSYGKAYERNKTLYKYNLQGLPYEMVINSNPCIAYLMKDNTLLLQILTMAHVYGHNDFFKNNRLFKEGTKAEYVIEMFKNHGDRIRRYIKDPSIGYEKVERVLDAAHALKFNINRVIGYRPLTREEKKAELTEKFYEETKVTSSLEDKSHIPFPDLEKIPLEPTEDLLGFIQNYGDLEDWERDLVGIVIEEAKYFLPQIETKIMNEGWASFWHYRLLNELDLPQSLHLEFLSRHNQVIRPFRGSINPYYVGFKLFEDIERLYGTEKIFEVRRIERDASFIRKYLTKDLAKSLNLFQYNKKGKSYIVDEIADESGWKTIRNTLANNVGVGSFPVIKVIDMSTKNNLLTLQHDYDGRELELKYAYETLKYISELWGNKVKLKTVINHSKKVISCDDDKKISMISDI